MVEWLKQLVIGDGNVVRERSYTNWNKLDENAIIAEKQKQETSSPAAPTERKPTDPKPESDTNT